MNNVYFGLRVPESDDSCTTKNDISTREYSLILIASNTSCYELMFVNCDTYVVIRDVLLTVLS
jgi:hypothetical protein